MLNIKREETAGKGAAQRTIYHLSNGWWIVDNGSRKQREHRFSLYKGTQNRATFVHGDDKFKRLLEYANQKSSDKTE